MQALHHIPLAHRGTASAIVSFMAVLGLSLTSCAGQQQKSEPYGEVSEHEQAEENSEETAEEWHEESIEEATELSDRAVPDTDDDPDDRDD